MKNKGFTLIEVLGVIVVLSVIALITTPVVMQTINDAKVGAALSSGNGFIEALENSIGSEMVFNTGFDATLGLFDGQTFNGKQGKTKIDVEFKGQKPSDVVLKIEDGIVTAGGFVINGQSIIVRDDGSLALGNLSHKQLLVSVNASKIN